jgi:hypothetical protein
METLRCNPLFISIIRLILINYTIADIVAQSLIYEYANLRGKYLELLANVGKLWAGRGEFFDYIRLVPHQE